MNRLEKIRAKNNLSKNTQDEYHFWNQADSGLIIKQLGKGRLLEKQEKIAMQILKERKEKGLLEEEDLEFYNAETKELKEGGNISDNIKKVKSFKTDEGNFSIYDTEVGGARGRADMFTVHENKKGWVIRNSFVPIALQKSGIATRFYISMNEQSLKKTGHPLRSTQPRTLLTGEVVHELSKDGIALWDSLVRKGYAKKLGEKNYVFNEKYQVGGKISSEEYEKRINNAKTHLNESVEAIENAHKHIDESEVELKQAKIKTEFAKDELDGKPLPFEDGGIIKVKTKRKEHIISVGDITVNEATEKVKEKYPNFREFEYKRNIYKKTGKNGEFIKKIEPPETHEARWQKKKDHIRELSDNISSLKNNVTRDLNNYIK